MKILLIGDIVGRPGREAVKIIVPELRKDRGVELVVGNVENIAGGSGLTPDTVDELLNSQMDVLTSGDHIWKKKDIYKRLDSDQRILRPANYPEECPGRGATVIKSSSNKAVGVVNVLGRVFMNHINGCPFRAAEKEVKKISKDTKIILVDVHAEATSEKIALGRFLDGSVSAIFGTHTHVQTADEKILPRGSAYITDLGMTGPQDSVIGRNIDTIIEHFITCMPARFDIAEKDIELQGAIVDIDEDTGKAISIERVREKVEDYL
ncbi:MAG: TIGR00282 family metallophosphoesterase [Candidatus Omnitrophica bacterium]|nr:TIGR00282 family metallophosphoesterase [Candidatus Omnitrophota bacterium]MBU1854016.1 TIGR00282 family metallophosphoesterase [Candidatus Omnitrophota bacterium]